MYIKLSASQGKIELDHEDRTILFLFDSTPQNFEASGIPADEEMIAEENARALIHGKLIELFDKYPEKVVLFENAISADPSNGYMNFVSAEII